jgi:hypothetical protein
MQHDETSDPRDLLGSLRPQIYGSGSPAKIVDPIVEPLWVGVRAMAAIDDAGALLVDDQADPIDGVDAIRGALVAGLRATGLVLDGYLTKQVAQRGVSTYGYSIERPSLGSLIGLRRNRAVDAVALREEALNARTLEEGEEISFVATDLLWLDEAWLLDIPLLERRRLLESVVAESDLFRLGIYVRPPIETWTGSWRGQGFTGLTYKAANSRYRPGETNSDWTIAGMPVR